MTTKHIALMQYAAENREECPTGDSNPEDEIYIPLFFDPRHTPRSKEEVQYWIDAYVPKDKRHLWRPVIFKEPNDN